MKTTVEVSNAMRSYDELISKISENSILSMQAMSYVRGGGTDGDGSVPIIIIPKF